MIFSDLRQKMRISFSGFGLTPPDMKGPRSVRSEFSETRCQAGCGALADGAEQALHPVGWATRHPGYPGHVQARADPLPGAPWKTREAVELATLEWASWFNNYRLMAPLGYVPPVEANYYHSRNLEQQAMPA
jgi:transposase InsO family protein